ncbi:MAG: hypothetical protein HS101_09860 [Planctomycetia bacterium]|jgi:hypothetical protein|nr:hypothetical protein [Planctomycetia bacterium]OQZ06487.1 MAG: hypothetical protein B6D36_04715 [Planctomycetes bacterium UTPLA1]
MSRDRMTQESNEFRPSCTATKGEDWQRLGAKIRQAALAAAALHVCRRSWIHDRLGEIQSGNGSSAA